MTALLQSPDFWPLLLLGIGIGAIAGFCLARAIGEAQAHALHAEISRLHRQIGAAPNRWGSPAANDPATPRTARAQLRSAPR